MGRSSGFGDMERESCTGTRKGTTCGAPVFKCGHVDCGSVGCEKSGCDNRQFLPIEKCKDCGRSYERIKQYKPSASPDDGAGSTVVGRPLALPNIELLFGGVLGLVALGAVVAGLMGVSGGGSGAGVQTPNITGSTPSTIAYADICECYRDGGALAGTGVSTLSPRYRTGFVQCRAIFGPEGGEAWTAGWNARSTGKVVGAGCRSWQRGFGR